LYVKFDINKDYAEMHGQQNRNIWCLLPANWEPKTCYIGIICALLGSLYCDFVLCK